MPKTKTLKPDGYRLRMNGLRWFLFLECKGKRVEELGPFDYHEALYKAEDLNLPDLDRG